MGYSSTSEYTMQVYLTKKGIESLYNGGLKDKIKYFAIETDDAKYDDFEDLEYVYDGSKLGVYQTSASTITTIGDQLVPQLSGRVISNSEVSGDRIMKTNRNTVGNTVLYDPETQSTSTFSLTSYKVNGGGKYFNLRNRGDNKTPVVLGIRNMAALSYESLDVLRYGYTSKLEPIYNEIPAYDTPSFIGVSVTNKEYSKTEYKKIYIYNKSNKPLYIDSFAIKTIKPNSHFIGYTNDEVSVNSNTTKKTRFYGVNWYALDGNEYTDGELIIRTDKGIFDGTKTLLYPFEILEVEVKYAVVNAGSNKQHYRGQTISSPDNKEGVLEFVLEMVTFKSKEKLAADKLTTSASVIVPVKDSGFDADSFNE